MNSELSLSYEFSPEEVKLLAKFLRSNQDKLPDGLFKFYTTIEKKIYSGLSMREVAEFYS